MERCSHFDRVPYRLGTIHGRGGPPGAEIPSCLPGVGVLARAAMAGVEAGASSGRRGADPRPIGSATCRLHEVGVGFEPAEHLRHCPHRTGSQIQRATIVAPDQPTTAGAGTVRAHPTQLAAPGPSGAPTRPEPRPSCPPRSVQTSQPRPEWTGRIRAQRQLVSALRAAMLVKPSL
jgi:hypothetical protein